MNWIAKDGLNGTNTVQTFHVGRLELLPCFVGWFRKVDLGHDTFRPQAVLCPVARVLSLISPLKNLVDNHD